MQNVDEYKLYEKSFKETSPAAREIELKMTKEKKEKEFNPTASYLMIGAGACLIIVRFMSDTGQWSSLDILKVGIGVTIIGYGVFTLIRKK